MKFLNSISAERLRELLDYNPETGEFTWRESKGSRKAGGRAGAKNSNGYILITINGVSYRAHRLAWLYVYGVWPDGDLDHRNRNKLYNKISNLRPATTSQNNANARRYITNKSGFKGVHFRKDNKNHPWRAQIVKDCKTRHLGYFATPEEAHEAYGVEARRIFGEFARVA